MKTTKEQKIKLRKERRNRRNAKRQKELKEIHQVKWDKDITFRQARSIVRRNYTAFICEMRYGDCEQRGYCNGDC